jgi:DNA-binding IclR family transcriptional regulator
MVGADRDGQCRSPGNGGARSLALSNALLTLDVGVGIPVMSFHHLESYFKHRNARRGRLTINENRTHGAQTVDRALAVLDALRVAGSEMRLRDISAAVDLNATAVHRLLSSLMGYGFVEQDPLTRSYRLGWGLLSFSDALLRGTQLADISPPIARRLRDISGETVSVQVRSGSDRVCIFEAEGLHDVRRRVGIGSRLPLYASASGRAILAFLPGADLDRLLRGKLRAITPNTTTDLDQLRRILAVVRQTGIARSHDESVVGASAIAAPVFQAADGPVGSIAITGPSPRWTGVDTPELEREVLLGAAELSERLGAREFPDWLSMAPEAATAVDRTRVTA